MPGDRWQKLANLRALLRATCGRTRARSCCSWAASSAQEREWNHDASLDWHLLDRRRHAGVQKLVRDLNHLYKDHAALWELDADPSGFRWLVVDDRDANVLAFARFSAQGAPLVMVANLSPVPRPAYRVPMPFAGRWKEVLNSDADAYGGANLGNLGGVVAVGHTLGRRERLGRDGAAAPRRGLAGARIAADVLPWERPLGATPDADGRTVFRVWAPNAGRVAALVNGTVLKLEAVGGGVFEGETDARPGDDYHLVVDGGVSLPDPCSRFQPEGVRGPSRVVDPSAFAWTDAGWGGLAARRSS